MISTTSSAGDLSAPSPECEPPRSLTTTFAPWAASSSASPRPMPRPAPVTTATFPSSSPTGVTSESCVLERQPYLTRVSQYRSGCDSSQGGEPKGGQRGLDQRRGRRHADRQVECHDRAGSRHRVRGF